MKKRKQFIAVMLTITLIISAIPVTTFAADPLIQTFDLNAADKTEQQYYFYSFHTDESPSRYVNEKVIAESTLKFKVHSVKDMGTQWQVTYSTAGYVIARSEKWMNDFYPDISVTLNGEFLPQSSYDADGRTYRSLGYENYPSTKQMTINVPKIKYGWRDIYNEDGDYIRSEQYVIKNYGLKLDLNIRIYASGYEFWGGVGTFSGSTTLDRTFSMNMNKLPQYEGASITPQSNPIDGIVYLNGQPGRDIFNLSGRAWDAEGHTITAKLDITYFDYTKPGYRTMTKQQTIVATPTTQPSSNNFSLSVNINSELFDGVKPFEQGISYYATLTLNDGYDTTLVFSHQQIRIDKYPPFVSIESTKVKGGTKALVNTSDTGIIYLVPYGSYTPNELDSLVNGSSATKLVTSVIGAQTMTAPTKDGYYRAFSVDRANNISPISSQTLVVDSTAPSLISSTVAGDTITLVYDEALDPSSTPANDDYFFLPNKNVGGLTTLVAGEDTLNLVVLSMDYENDPLLKETFAYTHDPSYFENSNGKASFDGVTRNTPVTIFNNVGLYKLNYSVIDKPRDAAGFEEYQLPSNVVELLFLVHRRPIADFSANSRYISATAKCDITITDLSKDLDHESLTNKGIVAYNWKWKLSTDTTWTVGKPTSLTPGFTYNISLEVKDIEGAWSAPVIKSISPSTADLNTPPTVTISYNPSFIYEGDTVNIVMRPVDPDGGSVNLRLERRINGGSFTEIAFYNNVLSNSMVTYPISSIGLGTYEFRVIAIDPYNTTGQASTSFTVNGLSITGQVNHTILWNENRIKYNRSKTNSDNSPRTYDVFFPGEKFVLAATTTAINPLSNVTASTVNVSINNKGLNSNLVKLGSNSWNGSLWNESMLSWPNQSVEFIFTVTYSNGTVKTYTVIIRTIDDQYWRQHTSF